MEQMREERELVEQLREVSVGRINLCSWNIFLSLSRRILKRLNEAILLLQITLMRLFLKCFILARCLYFRRGFVKMRHNNESYLNDIQSNSMPCTAGINSLFNFIRKDEVIT